MKKERKDITTERHISRYTGFAQLRLIRTKGSGKRVAADVSSDSPSSGPEEAEQHLVPVLSRSPPLFGITSSHYRVFTVNNLMNFRGSNPVF